MSESAGQHSGWLLDTEVRGEGEVQGDLGVVVMIKVLQKVASEMHPKVRNHVITTAFTFKTLC